jgi:mannose-6-phosphate isomerase-like protein (cupin superfamily)
MKTTRAPSTAATLLNDTVRTEICASQRRADDDPSTFDADVDSWRLHGPVPAEANRLCARRFTIEARIQRERRCDTPLGRRGRRCRQSRLADDRGGYSLIEDLVPPGLGAPLHVHTREDEAIYVTAGELEVTVAETRRLAKPGDVVHMPRRVPHGFRNASERPARMLIVFSPGGFERGFLEIGKPVGSEETPPTLTRQEMQRMREVAERYGARWVS